MHQVLFHQIATPVSSMEHHPHSPHPALELAATQQQPLAWLAGCCTPVQPHRALLSRHRSTASFDPLRTHVQYMRAT
jgi:hypothetical protein